MVDKKASNGFWLKFEQLIDIEVLKDVQTRKIVDKEVLNGFKLKFEQFIDKKV